MVHKSYSTSKTNRDYLDPTLTEDDTFLNYLALAAAILDPMQRKDMRYFLSGLYDEEEAKASWMEREKKYMEKIHQAYTLGFTTGKEIEEEE